MKKFDTPFLRVRNLRIGFRGVPRPTVDTVSFSLERGKTLGVIGESGSGKSLTGLAILGMLPPRARVLPGSEISFMGQDLCSLSYAQWRGLRGKGIGVVFQEPMSSLNPLMRVGTQVLEAVRQNNEAARSQRAALARTEELFEEVGLPFSQSALRAYPHEYSGGMQQRVMIAMALAGNPSLLIADEPTSALDVTVQSQILQVLKEARERRDMAMLFISHDLDIVSSLAHEVLVLHQGLCEEYGPVDTVFHTPAADYTRFLLQNRLGGPRVFRMPAVACAALQTDGRPDDRTGERPMERPMERKTPDDPVALRVRKVSIGYGGGLFSAPHQVLGEVSCELRQGKCLGIVGESGSGKSSLAKAVVGMAEVLEGDIEIFGKNIRTLRSADKRALAGRCQIIFQNTYTALNPRLPIKTILAEPLQVQGAACPPERLRAMLEEVGLGAAHAEAYPHQLSGGQRQRVNIARSLALDPQILLCDEIVSALDVSVQAQILALLQEIRQKRAMSLVFISHDLRVIRHMADEVLVLKAGKMVEYGSVEEVWLRPKCAYTRLLLSSVPGLSDPQPASERELQRVSNL